MTDNAVSHDLAARTLRSAGACSGFQFVVPRAGEAYDARVSDRKFRLNTYQVAKNSTKRRVTRSGCSNVERWPQSRTTFSCAPEIPATISSAQPGGVT